MINGIQYNWEGVTIKAPHGTMYDVVNITYKDKRAVNRLYGKGSRARGYSRGREEADGELEMRREEYEAMRRSWPNGIYSGKPFPITASYAKDDGPTITDELRQCLFEARDFGVKEDDEGAMVKLSFKILGGIADNGKLAFPETR